MQTLNHQLAEGRLFANLPAFGKVVQTAEQRVRKMLARHSKVYVSNSWGKQSVVLAHLVFSVDPQAVNVHFTGVDAALIADFAAVRDLFLARWPAPYEEPERGLSLREAIVQHNAASGADGYFVGLVAYESKGRKATVAASGSDQYFHPQSGLPRCTPIGDWSELMLAAYIAKHELPLLSTYKKYSLFARTSTGCKPGSYTERAVDYMSSLDAAEMRERHRERSA